MAKLKFIGTRGEIEARTAVHNMHTSLLVCAKAGRVMIDCGLDWLGKAGAVAPDAIVLTHAHMDHAWGLREGAPCPVYATDRTWSTLEKCDIENRVTLPLRSPTEICGVLFEAFPVEHSVRCPAVGYQVRISDKAFFYSPDVVHIPDREAALSGIDMYIGDGATITKSMVRKRGNTTFGHTPVRTQLTWCEQEKVPRAIFTHCGSEIVAGDQEVVKAKVATLGAERQVEAEIAYDGMEVGF